MEDLVANLDAGRDGVVALAGESVELAEVDGALECPTGRKVDGAKGGIV